MIGRGLVACPDLALVIQRSCSGEAAAAMGWESLHPWLVDFYAQVRERGVDRHVPGRLKQWLALLAGVYPQARILFDQIRRQTCADQVAELLEQGSAAQLPAGPASPRRRKAVGLMPVQRRKARVKLLGSRNPSS